MLLQASVGDWCGLPILGLLERPWLQLRWGCEQVSAAKLLTYASSPASAFLGWL